MSGREAAGLLLLAGGCLAVGLALLAGLGLLPRRRWYTTAALALAAGWALSGLLVSYMLMAGLAAALWQLVVAWTVVAGAALAAARRLPARAASSTHPPRRPAHPLVVWLPQLAVGSYLAALLVRALLPLGTLNPDAWTQWLSKAKVIYHLGGLDTGIGGYTSQVNNDYPPLHPALEATTFRFAGSDDFLVLPLFHWIVLAAFVGAVAHLLVSRTSSALVWSSLAMLLFAPKLTALVGSSLADEPLSLFLGLAGVTGALWLLERTPGLVVLAGLFLAAAALTKNEGLALALVLGALLALASRSRAGVALLLTPALAYAPWKLWLVANDVPASFAYDFSRLFHPAELLDRTAYLEYGVRSLLEHLFAPSQWLLIVPAGLILGLLAARRRSPVAFVGLAFPVVVVLAYSVVYWVGNGICTWLPGSECDGSWRDIEWLVGPSADRIVASVAVLLAAIFPLLVVGATGGALDRDGLAAERPHEA